MLYEFSKLSISRRHPLFYCAWPFKMDMNGGECKLRVDECNAVDALSVLDETLGISSTVSLTRQIVMIWHKCFLFLWRAMYVVNFYIFNVNPFKNINMAAALLLSVEAFSKASVWLNRKSNLNTKDSMSTKFDILKNVFYNFFRNLYR